MVTPPSRRTLFGVAAALVVAVGAGATIGVVTSDRPDNAALIPLHESPITADGTTPTPSASTSPTPTPTPKPTATTAAPTASPTPRDTPTAAATRSSGGGYTNYGPRPPGTVTAPYVPGQRSWDVTSNGFRIRVSATAAKAGTPMTWTVDASSGARGCCAVYLLFGDGYGATPTMECDAPDPSVSYTHTYNRGGRKEFMVQVGDSRSCGASGDGGLYGTFDVADGPSTSQGPSLPVVKFDTSTPVPGHEGDHRYVSLYAEAQERDGHLTKLVVDFGDGTSKSFAGDQNPCRRSPDGWPTGSMVWLPHDPPPYHRYAKPGTYRLTLTAYSAGCDGRQVQTGKASFTWTVPTPEPTETPSPTASPSASASG